jgi:hypothetical protein
MDPTDSPPKLTRQVLTVGATYKSFQKDFARCTQNAVVRPAIAEVHTNRELVSFENHVSIYPNSASLDLHEWPLA